MPKRTPDQLHYWSEAYKLIGLKLRAHYQASTTDELPPRLLAVLKKLDEKSNLQQSVEVVRHGGKLRPRPAYIRPRRSPFTA
jgi:hypothetical protein